jgi:predicted hydrocarbon binding protein
MSLLMQRKAPAAAPRIEGKEVLEGNDPSVAKVKGVMFGGRKQFLLDLIGEARFNALVEKLTPRTRNYARTPLASSWCEFASIVELDRAIHDELKAEYPHILALAGAASAELGIGRIYRSLDSDSLVEFFETNARFHDQYQKFGKVRFEKTPSGGRVIHSDYPVYSPVYCASAVGYFMEAILRHGGSDPSVVETKCQCRGDATCTFDMKWR